MYKLILSVVIIISAFLFGNTYSQRLSHRCEYLQKFIEAIRKAKTIISFGGCEIDRVIDESFGEIEGFYPEKISESLDNSVFEQWNKAVELIPKCSGLDSKDRETIRRFGEGLGLSDTQGQAANCELFEELLCERLREAKEAEKQKSRLYRVLGFSFGCVITLLIM